MSEAPEGATPLRLLNQHAQALRVGLGGIIIPIFPILQVPR